MVGVEENVTDRRCRVTVGQTAATEWPVLICSIWLNKLRKNSVLYQGTTLVVP
jgi:hypothetical protein